MPSQSGALIRKGVRKVRLTPPQSSEFRVRRRLDHDFGETLEPSQRNYNHDTAKLEHADHVSKRCRMPSSQMIRYRNKQ